MFTTKTDNLPAGKCVCASIKLKQGAKPIFCAARKVSLPLDWNVDPTIDELLSLGLLAPVEAGGVENCSPVVWFKRSEKLGLCADYKLHVINKNNTEAYPLPCFQTFFSKTTGPKHFAKIDLLYAYWETALNAKSQEVCTVNTT